MLVQEGFWSVTCPPPPQHTHRWPTDASLYLCLSTGCGWQLCVCRQRDLRDQRESSSPRGGFTLNNLALSFKVVVSLFCYRFLRNAICYALCHKRLAHLSQCTTIRPKRAFGGFILLPRILLVRLAAYCTICEVNNACLVFPILIWIHCVLHFPARIAQCLHRTSNRTKYSVVLYSMLILHFHFWFTF